MREKHLCRCDIFCKIPDVKRPMLNMIIISDKNVTLPQVIFMHLACAYYIVSPLLFCKWGFGLKYVKILSFYKKIWHGKNNDDKNVRGNLWLFCIFYYTIRTCVKILLFRHAGLVFPTKPFHGDSGLIRKQIRHHIVCKLASVFYDKAAYGCRKSVYQRTIYCNFYILMVLWCLFLYILYSLFLYFSFSLLYFLLQFL